MFGKILLNPSVDKRQNHKADNYKSQYIIKQNKGRLCNTNVTQILQVIVYIVWRVFEAAGS